MSEMMHKPVIKFYHPFMMTICGPSQSGKTYFIKRLIENNDEIFHPPFTKLLFYYSSTYQDIFDEIIGIIKENKNNSMLKEYEFIKCKLNSPSVSEIKQKLGKQTLIILDDLMINAVDNKENTKRIDELATRDCHHEDFSIIFTCQNINYGNTKLRTARANSQYIVVFNNVGDNRNLKTILYNKDLSKNILENLIDDMNKDNHGYIVFDNHIKSENNVRIRKNIFPNEITTIYDVNN